ncbi:hypothetical protein T03_10378 [Trichinella britovi]|uniref:Uncharacterized protein n=1 Tax=Trichinella britovi TaxID=45882 RepID=A0A0V1CZM5_TRIBR|nr:hypothetical protein T03_10378 [Trichinella britovi]
MLPVRTCLTTSNPERERGCGGVTSVIFRYGVHIFCHTKTCYKTVLPIHCNEKQWEMHKVRIVSLSKGVSKQDGIVEVPEDMHFDMEGKYESDSTNPFQEETKWECKCEFTVTKSKHGILVPEETDCSGITSITNSRSRRRDRQEKRTGRKPLKEKTTRSPGKEKILTGVDLEMIWKRRLSIFLPNMFEQGAFPPVGAPNAKGLRYKET